MSRQGVRIVCVSDTHGLHRRMTIPNGDLLLHAGDLTNRGEPEQVEDFNEWLGFLPHPHKIVIAGNHDLSFEDEPKRVVPLLTNAMYLQDSHVVVAGLTVYGSPWQPWFFKWAFNLQRGAEIKAKWDLIPTDTDVLLTHGPPHGVGDRTTNGDAAGCVDLLQAVHRVKPKLHVFGHIHEGYGMRRTSETIFVNASSCTATYEPTHDPVVVDL